MAGLIKTLLALERELIPRSLYGDPPHPDLPLGAQFRLVPENVPWPRRERAVRRAAVSAFGFGGANAHVIVEEAPRPARTEPAPPRACELLLLSAKSEYSRQALEARTAQALRASDGPALPDLCFTLRTGRTPLPLRCAVVARDREQLAAAIEARDDARCTRGRAGRALRVALLSGPHRPASAALVASLRAAWPKLSARALAEAERHAARVEHAGARERVLRECYLAALLLVWGITPSWFLADDAVAGWTGAYLKARLGRGDPAVPLAPGWHDLKTGAHLEREPQGARLPAGLKLLALSGTGEQHAIADASTLAPFAGEDGPWPALLGAWGQLWVEGLNVDWSAFDAEHGRSCVPAPAYPFERRRSWFA